MNTVHEILEELQVINRRYELPDSQINNFLEGYSKEPLCIPIIGAFNSGKSSAVNTLLGYRRKILTEDITPETAVPVEIQYQFDQNNEESARIAYTDGHTEIMPFNQYIERGQNECNVDEIASVRLQLNHAFFETIPQVMLVDMPGFGSGNDIHNKAIDNYISNSMAYIVAFPADDLIMRDGVGSILKELVALNKPVCLMITKTDKAPPLEDYTATFELLKKNLAKYIGNREIEWLETSSRDGNVEQLEKYLLKMQDESQRLLWEQKFLPFLQREANKTLTYLRERAAKVGLSESELKEQEIRLDTDMKHLLKKTAELAAAFRKETEQCAQEVIADTRMALNRDLDSLVTMAMNSDGERKIAESINSTVRIATNESVQRRFVSKAEKYARGVSAEISTAESLIFSGYSPDGKTDSPLGDAAGGALFSGVVTTAITTLFPAGASTLISTLGIPTIAIAAIPIPLVGIVVAAASLVGGIISYVVGGNKKREEAKAQIRRKFEGEVFSSVLSQLLPIVQTELLKQTDAICADIEQQLQERRETLEKALADIRSQQAAEAEENNQIIEKILKDIKRVEVLCRVA